jgi:DNA-binding MarR family transcriptional regulator
VASQREVRMQAVYSEMERISRRAVARNRRTAAPLTVVQHTLLTFISTTPDCRAIDIAQSLRLNRSTISRQVGDLVDLGLVETRAESAGRGQILVLTDRGRGLLDRSLRANHAELERRLQGWSDDEIDRLARGLERFNAVDGD